MHEREQLCANDLFIDVNKPLRIDSNLVGRWISISWFRTYDHNSVNGFYAFYVGFISSIFEKRITIVYGDSKEMYDAPLTLSNWTNEVNLPPTRQFQWRLLYKKASVQILYVIGTFSLTLTPYVQDDVVLQHEIHQLDEYDLVVDTTKPILDRSLIGKYISISYRRETVTLVFFAFDVGLVTDVKKGQVYIDYKDEGTHAVRLRSSGWNCSTSDTPKSQHNWRMLAKKKIQNRNIP